MSMLLVEWVSRSRFGLRTTSLVLLYGCVALDISILTAQGPHTVKSGEGVSQTEGLPSQTMKQSKGLVTLTVSDSSVSYVIREIIRQTGIKVIYDRSNEALAKKIRISIRDKTPLEALQLSLNGIGVSVKVAPDGETLIIGGSEKAPAALNQDVKGGSIAGTILDSATRKGISGVTVMLIGTRLSATTGDDGRFLLSNVPNGNYQLSAKVLGFGQRHVAVVINGTTVNLNVSLTATATSLNEVVTTAAGPQRRVEVAHDIATINPAKIMARSPARSVADILEAAQVPGVQVQRASGDPGAATKIRMRGISSISQSNDPVVVVDGIWIDAATSSPSKLDDIDPSTIEKIEIVRGPSAATLYGQDASNGVIVITTKKGKAGVTRWNLAYNRDWGKAYGKLPLSYAGLGYMVSNPSAIMFCNVSDVAGKICIQDTVLVLDPNDPLVLRDGQELNNTYRISVDGGSNSVTYAITGSVVSTAGVRKISDADMIRLRKVGYPVNKDFATPSQLNRRNFTSRLDLNPYRNLAASLTLTTAQTQLRNNTISARWGGRYFGALGNSTLSYFNADTNLRSDLPHSVSSKENPVTSNTSIVGGTAQYRPGYGFVINANLGAETGNTESSEYLASAECFIVTGCVDTTSSSLSGRSERAVRRNMYTARLNTSTSLDLGKLNRFLDIRPSLGGDLKRVKTSNISVQKTNIPPGDRSISSGVVVPAGTGHKLDENATAGWYLNSTIGIAKRVYFDVGVRQDIGSAITSSANYPKLGGSWLISDESFWRNNSYVNLLRLRAAIGHSAVQPDMQDLYGSYVSSVEYLDGKFVRSARLRSVGNNALTPERATELELGFDTDVIYERVNVGLTYATSVNKNALVVKQVPISFGPSSPSNRKENIARVSNKNFELSIASRIIENRTTRLLLDYGLTLTENRVEKLGSAAAITTVQEGYPIAGVWNRSVLGYSDINGDGLIGRDEVILSDDGLYVGWSQPRYRSSYGVSITFLNQITFDSRFAYQSQYVRNIDNESIFRYGSQNVDAPLEVQAQEVVIGFVPTKTISDLRWNSASIQYQIPQSLLRRINARSLAVSIQGSNLALWTNYMGRDPSINDRILSGEGALDRGTSPPPARLYVLDFKLGF